MADEATEVDVVVIGLGPGGEATATQLAQAGLDVVAVDRRLVGGECPYYGCIPTKMMIRGSDLIAEGRRIPEVSGTATVEPDWSPVAKRIAEEATSDWDDQIAVDRLQDAGARVLHGVGRLDGPKTVVVGDERFVARTGVVLNPGTEPAVPPIDGLADTPYWTNRDAVQLTELPDSLIAIGGGAISLELAQAFSRFGVDVTVLEVAPRLLPVEEPESSRLIADVFAREGIQVLTGATISSVSYDDGRFTASVDGQSLMADKLLVAAGRRPNLSDIGLETVGLDPSARVLETDEAMRVESVDGLWAIGDVTGKGAFTHMSMYQSAVATRSVLGQEGPPADYRAVPRVTFTDPEIGGVGMSEQQARD
ncbi:MAG TPA: NAD(P)/FAD-dependent oxidoreductase, partial [Nocardioidaceae bacterium]